mgnify:CR=1 FL=1
MAELNPIEYIRHRGKADPIKQGTLSITTTGELNQGLNNLEIVGDVIDISDYHLHSYQMVPEEGTFAGGVDGTFRIEVSNNGDDWTALACFLVPTVDAPVVYSDYFNFKFARARITGLDGKYTIVERHNSYS